ncbi:MAG TPA: AAA family ATPase [Tepidisphaeraceae bacterium]|nr:AAA family ATPase [Tepidisphaeraceae bacterium]
MKKIVITGAPGSGKTVITARLAAAHPEQFAMVPEAATQVYTALRTRWDQLDLAGRRDAQRRMYRLQLEQEERLSRQHAGGGALLLLLLDRGTVDGSAYWPDGPDAFWRDVDTTRAAELARYDAVILLQTCAALGLYDGDASNACRFEDADAAIAAGETLRQLWGDHPRVRHVAAYPKLDDKVDAVRAAIADVLRAQP